MKLETEYCYIFKDKYRRILLEDFNRVDDKIGYVDILEYNKNYSEFIRKLLYLLVNLENFKHEEFLIIEGLLTSEKVIDRLNGLKRCRIYIKIEGVLSDSKL